MEISEKLGIFFDAVIEAANKQSSEILEEQKQTYQGALAEYEKGKQDSLSTRTHIAEAQIRKEINRTVSEQEILLKKEYHDKEEKMKEELFSLVEEKLLAYQKTKEYQQLLAQKIVKAKQFAAGEAMTVYIDPTDSALKEVLEQETGCEITISREDFWGGMRAVIRSKNVLIDESFVSRVTQEKELYSF